MIHHTAQGHTGLATVGDHARQENRKALFMSRIPRNKKSVRHGVRRPTVRCGGGGVGSVVAFFPVDSVPAAPVKTWRIGPEEQDQMSPESDLHNK